MIIGAVVLVVLLIIFRGASGRSGCGCEEIRGVFISRRSLIANGKYLRLIFERGNVAEDGSGGLISECGHCPLMLHVSMGVLPVGPWTTVLIGELSIIHSTEDEAEGTITPSTLNDRALHAMGWAAIPLSFWLRREDARSITIAIDGVSDYAVKVD